MVRTYNRLRRFAAKTSLAGASSYAKTSCNRRPSSTDAACDLRSPRATTRSSSDESRVFDGDAASFLIDLGTRNRFAGSITFDSLTPYTIEDDDGIYTLTVDDVRVLNGTGHLVSVELPLPDATRYDISSGADLTLSGPLTGIGSLNKAGVGTLILAGANTYTGATTIEAGTLEITDGNVSALANTAVTVEAGATLRFDDEDGYDYEIASLAGSGTVIGDVNGQANIEIGGDSSSTTFAGSIDLPNFGRVIKHGSGTFTLTGDGHDFSRLDLNAGEVVLDGVGGDLGTLDVASGTTITVRNTGPELDSLGLNSFGNILITGAGTEVTLDGINQGELRVEDGAAVTIDNAFDQTGFGSVIIDQASLSLESFSG